MCVLGVSLLLAPNCLTSKHCFPVSKQLCCCLKGNLRLKKKLSSNEKALKMKKKIIDLSLTTMCQMVLAVSHSKVNHLSKVEVTILEDFSLIFT